MEVLDISKIEIILKYIDKEAFDNTHFRFCMDNGNLCLLGSGGSAYVYKMYDPKFPNRHYAAKVIISDVDDVYFEKLQSQVRNQFSLSEDSKNIVRILAFTSIKVSLDEKNNPNGYYNYNESGYDLGRGIVLHIVIMEELKGIISQDKYGNVKLLIDELKTESGVITLAKQIGSALRTSHDRKILHRDIKLENIFWDDKEKIYKLGDFGASRYVENEDAGTIIYTDGYGAPEIERKIGTSYGATVDVYSFGITLYLLLNDLKFPASDSYQAREMQYTDTFILPAPKNASDRMAAIIRKMCCFRANERYQSVEEVLMEIGKIDGSYTEYGFTEEYDDGVTETYISETEEADSISDTPSSDNATVPMYERDESTWSRQERKENEKSNRNMNLGTLIFGPPILSVLFFLLISSFICKETTVKAEILIIPLILLFYAISIYIGELYNTIFLLSVGVIIYLSSINGLSPVYIIALVVIISGSPLFLNTCAVGILLWLFQIYRGSTEISAFLLKHNLKWPVIIVTLIYGLSLLVLSGWGIKRRNIGEKICNSLGLLVVGLISLSFRGIKILTGRSNSQND